MKMIIVSGLSGAGKSVALRVLEDLGYYCVDNLPLNLLNSFIDGIDLSTQKVAVSIDIRNLPKDINYLPDTLAKLKQRIDIHFLFLNADEKTLLKRYSETRRLHPLSHGEHACTLEQAIQLEQKLLLDLKEEADVFIDTTLLSLHDLSETIRIRLQGACPKALKIVFQSFGYKFGIPSDADYVFDVRFLPNPHWIESLRPYTGLDQPVIDFLSTQDEVKQLEESIAQFILKWLPSLERNNRSYLTVAIGCTGGKHRSVYLTQSIGNHLKSLGHDVTLRHITLEKSKPIATDG